MFDFLDEINNPKGTPLKFEGYEKYHIQPLGKGQWIFRFKNNYGASIIKHWGSYGYEDDLFELAVIYFDENGNSELTYNTEITNEVVGYLSNEEVLNLLEEIKNLDENGRKTNGSRKTI